MNDILSVPHRNYGLLAEFEEPEALTMGVQKARAAGFRKMDAYTPFPIDGLAEELGKAPTRLPVVALVGGILGGITGYGMQYYASVISYPMNVGGRPHHSWPAFIPIVFELTVLGAALFTVLGMLALNGLPMPHHPLFGVPEFESASRDRFFLLIEATDPQFDLERTRQFLQEMGPHKVLDVPR